MIKLLLISALFINHQQIVLPFLDVLKSQEWRIESIVDKEGTLDPKASIKDSVINKKTALHKAS